MYMSYHLRGTPYPGIIDYTKYMISFREMKTLDCVQPLLPGFTPVVNDVRNFKYGSEIKCDLNQANNASTVFIAIKSLAGNYHQRKSIRETWLKYLKEWNHTDLSIAGYGFVIMSENFDQNLQAESDQWKDILHIEMKDGIAWNSIAVTRLLNWIDINCQASDFIFKTNDNVYLRVNNFRSFVKTLDRGAVNNYGKINNDVVIRKGRWTLTYEEYPWPRYPTYVSGSALLISGRAIRPLLAAAQTIPFHQFDDVYIAGLCAKRANVPIFHNWRIFKVELLPTPCDIRNMVAWDAFEVDKMRHSHEKTEKFIKNINLCIPKGSVNPVGEYSEFRLEKIS